MNPHGSYIVPAIVKHASTNQQPGDMMSSYSIIQDVFFLQSRETNKQKDLDKDLDIHSISPNQTV